MHLRVNSEDDAMNTVAELQRLYRWSFLGEAGQRVNAVLASVTEDSAWQQFLAWERYLRTVLKFPFEAEVVEFQEHGILQTGDILKVMKIEMVNDSYGIIVHCQRRRRDTAAVLADLEVTNRQSVNYQPVRDYAIWFANR